MIMPMIRRVRRLACREKERDWGAVGEGDRSLLATSDRAFRKAHVAAGSPRESKLLTGYALLLR